MQNRRSSSVLAMEIRLFCIKTSISGCVLDVDLFNIEERVLVMWQLHKEPAVSTGHQQQQYIWGIKTLIA